MAAEDPEFIHRTNVADRAEAPWLLKRLEKGEKLTDRERAVLVRTGHLSRISSEEKVSLTDDYSFVTEDTDETPETFQIKAVEAFEKAILRKSIRQKLYARPDRKAEKIQRIIEIFQFSEKLKKEYKKRIQEWPTTDIRVIADDLTDPDGILPIGRDIAVRYVLRQYTAEDVAHEVMLDLGANNIPDMAEDLRLRSHPQDYL